MASDEGHTRERGLWVQRFRNSEESLGEVIAKTTKDREAVWLVDPRSPPVLKATAKTLAAPPPPPTSPLKRAATAHICRTRRIASPFARASTRGARNLAQLANFMSAEWNSATGELARSRSTRRRIAGTRGASTDGGPGSVRSNSPRRFSAGAPPLTCEWSRGASFLFSSTFESLGWYVRVSESSEEKAPVVLLPSSVEIVQLTSSH